MRSTPADFDHAAELHEENRGLRAELAKVRAAQKAAQDAFLWAEEKREARRAAEREAFRELANVCAGVGAVDLEWLREVRKRGGLDG